MYNFKGFTGFEQLIIFLCYFEVLELHARERFLAHYSAIDAYFHLVASMKFNLCDVDHVPHARHCWAGLGLTL